MEKTLHTLILEDSQSDTLLLVRELKRAGYEVEYTRVENAMDMTTALESKSWDVILSDYSMPQFSATAGLKLLQAMALDIPFIIISGTMGEETAVEAMKAGAQDYFPKGRITRLAVAIDRELREKKDREQRRQTEQELRQAEERFTKAFQASPIGITISSSDGYFLSVNESFRKMLGFQTGEIVGRSALELGIWNSPADQHLLEITTTSSQSPQFREIVLFTQSKETCYVSVSTEHIDVSGESCVLAMWQNVTDRILAEQSLKKNTQLNQLLQTITLAANEATEVNTLLQLAIDSICNFAGWPLAHIYMQSRGEENKLLSSGIWYVDNKELFEDFRLKSQHIQLNEATGGLIYRVSQSASPEWIIGIESAKNFVRAEAAQAVGIKSVYAFPIFSQYDVVAVMEFFSASTEQPDQALMDMIPQIATQIGHVIERTRANKEIQALYNATGYLFNAESIQELSRQIVRGVVEEFEQVDCGLLLVEPQTGEIKRLARTGTYHVDVRSSLTIDGPGLVSKAIREGQIIYAPNVQQNSQYIPNAPSTQSEMIVPLKTHNGVIGVIDLQSQQQDYFSQRDQRILGAFAERAAAALEITRLYEEINLYAAQLEQRVEERTQELQEAKERAEAILNNSSDAIILADMNGAIRQTNPRFVEVFGYDHDELFDHPLVDILSPENDNSISQILGTLLSNRKYQRTEVIARRKNGTTFAADAAFAPLARTGETEIVCSLRDISERKQLEQQLRTAFEKQRELTTLKTRFISTVSHEYRTPLAIIQTSSSMLLKYSDRMTIEKQHGHLNKILANVKRLTTLLDDVLDINRAETMGLEFIPEKVNFLALCQEMVLDTRQINPNYELIFNAFGEAKPLSGDLRLLRQIISNLLSNAVKYSLSEGTIRVTLQFTSQSVELKVSDQGRGIPPEDIDKLFTLFHRAGNVGHVQGTGLGLAIVKQAVDIHAGTIEVESAVGQGTTFIVTLPLQSSGSDASGL